MLVPMSWRLCLFHVVNWVNMVEHGFSQNCSTSMTLANCPLFPSRQLALMCCIRLREVSLMLMAIFRLWPLLMFRHNSQNPLPSWQWIRLFHACGYCQNLSLSLILLLIEFSQDSPHTRMTQHNLLSLVIHSDTLGSSYDWIYLGQ